MKKIIPPIIITILAIIYCIINVVTLFYTSDGKRLVLVVGVVVSLAVIVIMIGVCAERIKEIRSGEEDDLSKY